MPDQLFYNTGISTYVWIVTNRKNSQRKGKVQLIDGSSYFSTMRKSLGNKRHEISDSHREELVRLYGGVQGIGAFVKSLITLILDIAGLL